MTFDRYDVLVVPFPFSDHAITRVRPALALSDRAFIGETGSIILAMITTARRSLWPGDTPLLDYEAAGLKHHCKVRMKIFTLDARLVERHAGRLSERDAAQVSAAFTQIFLA